MADRKDDAAAHIFSRRRIKEGTLFIEREATEITTCALLRPVVVIPSWQDVAAAAGGNASHRQHADDNSDSSRLKSGRNNGKPDDAVCIPLSDEEAIAASPRSKDVLFPVGHAPELGANTRVIPLLFSEICIAVQTCNVGITCRDYKFEPRYRSPREEGLRVC